MAHYGRTRSWMAACIFVGLAAGQISAETIFRDDFQGSALGSAWVVLNRDNSYLSLSNGILSLRCSNGDLWQSSNNAKNVLLIPNPTNGDFDMTLAVQHFEPNYGGWTQVDLLAFDDVDNHYRGGYGNLFDLNNTRYLTNAREVQAQYIGTGNSPHNFGNSYFYLRVTKRGSTYHLYYSLNGVNFLGSGLGTTYGDGTPAYLGFVAMVDSSQVTVASIDYFEVATKPVGDCDDDFDVDLADFNDLSACLVGPELPLMAECECFDLDNDADADLADFAVFQNVFTGS